MLTGLVKSNTIVGAGLAYLISGLLLTYGFTTATSSVNVSDLLYAHWAFSWIEPASSWTFVLCVIGITGSILLSRIRFRESRTTLGNTNLSMVAFAAIVATQSKVLTTRPDVALATVLIISSFILLFSTYKRETALSEVFHIGLVVGFSSLFVGQAILFLLPIGFSIVISRSTTTKDWIVLALGLIMTVVFMLLFLVWSETPMLALQRAIQTAWLTNFSVDAITLGHITLIGVLLYAIIASFSDLTLGTVHDRNFTLMNLSWFVGGVFVVAFLGLNWQAVFVICAFPLANFVAKAQEKAPKWWLADLMLVLLLASPLIKNLWQI